MIFFSKISNSGLIINNKSVNLYNSQIPFLIRVFRRRPGLGGDVGRPGLEGVRRPGLGEEEDPDWGD